MRFVPNRPVITTEPRVVVDPGLPVGRHRFRLEVVDSSGNRSRPAELVVTIVDRRVVNRPRRTPINRPARPLR